VVFYKTESAREFHTLQAVLFLRFRLQWKLLNVKIVTVDFTEKNHAEMESGFGGVKDGKSYEILIV